MRRIRYILSLLAVVSLLSLVLLPFCGQQLLSPHDLFSTDGGVSMIFWRLRVPRVLLAWLSGSVLAVCGLIFQALFRNPLAEPTILGVSSGASFGAAFCIYMGWEFSFLGISGLSIAACVGALFCVLIVHGLVVLKSRRDGATLLLAGVALNFFFSSMVMIIQYIGAYPDSFRLLRWTLGGIQVIGFGETLRVVPAFVLALVAAVLWGPELDLLTCGEEIAVSRGVSLERTRHGLFLAVSFCVAVCVAVCGPIAFVGLMIPHLCRLMISAGHRCLAVASVFLGGAFLALCDTAARTLWAPMELPVGIITSFLGAPFFLYLLFRKR